MKIDIKSLLIGALLTINVMLIMGFDEHEEEKKNLKMADTK